MQSQWLSIWLMACSLRVFAQPMQQLPQGGVPVVKPKGLLTVRSLRIANNAAEGSKIYLGQPSSGYSVGTDTAGNFAVQQASAAQPLISLDQTNTLRLASGRLEAISVNAAGGVAVRGVQQWSLVHSEDFSAVGAGWSRPVVSQCAGIHMLGGYCKFSSGEVNKTFSALPPHSMVRVVANFHFIDRWIGESGYMKLNIGQDNCPVVVWSEQHAQQESKNGLSLCGQSAVPEGKFASSIDITVPHHLESVQLAFGSTMDAADPCDESWGVSGIEVYVRG